ncbi:phosphotransferase enzyme family protein [Nocardia sp. NPDC058176]|uniref:phosphotransferase enzyme family protein n=1 Tax=Nocardia sp. NPDC058176 TaxID=3346368 RepID=UPI0036DA4D00
MGDDRVFGMGDDPLTAPTWPALAVDEQTRIMTDDHVFGMGDAPLVEPTWPTLTEDEIARAVAATWDGVEVAAVEWHSPRPLSSTVGVRVADGEQLVVKRLPLRLRDRAALAEEYRFMAHLRTRGIPVPEVRAAVGDWAPSRGGLSEFGGFIYEVHRVGVGEDRYREDFSWSPYRDVGDATGAGTMLARLHLAAVGFDAPARSARPLVSSSHGDDVVSAFEWHIAHRPAVARFLGGRDWRAEIPDLRVDLDGVEPLWTHGDWHATNLLWDGHEVSSVIDFGLADRTTAVFDLAIAIERAAVDWVSLRDGGPANVREDQVTALIQGYRAERSLSRAEQTLLPAILPLAHIGYELSEIDYFRTVADEPRNAEIAYEDWLLGHLRWYETPAGRDLRDLVADLATS